MHKYRKGDEVLFEIPAVVIQATEGLIRVRFGDVEYDADPTALVMMKRSFHVADEVQHGDRHGVVTQTLEDGIFLVRFHNAAGTDAYKVLTREDLRHADGDAPAQSSVAPVTAPQPQVQPVSTPVIADASLTEVASQVAPVIAPTVPVAERATQATETTPPQAPSSSEAYNEESEEDETSSVAPSEAPKQAGINEMAYSLSGMLARTAPRRKPVDLEALGTTETVRESGEMILGEDMRIDDDKR